MAYQTYRVEIARDETREGAPAAIEITAYIDRMPETNHYSVGLLTRVPKEPIKRPCFNKYSLI
jgi:hypothetical protein